MGWRGVIANWRGEARRGNNKFIDVEYLGRPRLRHVLLAVSNNNDDDDDDGNNNDKKKKRSGTGSQIPDETARGWEGGCTAAVDTVHTFILGICGYVRICTRNSTINHWCGERERRRD